MVTALEKSQAKILVVDDTQLNLTLISCALESEYQILMAPNGATALEIASEAVPDIILLDVMMPDMDGFTVAEILAKTPKLCNIPIIFLTALSDQKSQIRGLELGAVDFLTKPVVLKILRKRVANVLERERLRTDAVKNQALMHELLVKQTEARNTLESAFNASNDALLVTNHVFDILKINGNVQSLFVCQENDLIGTSFRQFRFCNEQEECFSADDLIGLDTPHEFTVHTPTGKARSVAVTGRVFHSGSEELHYLFTLRDISVRLALEKERRQAEAKLREALFELGMQKEALDEHALVSITDSAGIFIYANEKFCATSGYHVDELIGQSYKPIKSDEHSTEFYAAIWSQITSGKTWHGEMASRQKQGGLYWVSATIVPWLGQDGVPYQYVGIYTDISDRIKTEQQLALSRKRELDVGASIQKRLLFGHPPAELEGFSLACFSEASQGVDGDFYTFTQLSSSCFEVFTGDVMGKGVAAALIAAGVINTYHKVFSELVAKNTGGMPPSPAELINGIHAVMTSELIKLNAFVTLSLVRFDAHEKTATWVNAGHTPTLMASADGQEIRELLGENLPLGIVEDESYSEHVTPIDTGETLLLYSDGISESVNTQGIEYGVDLIKAILSQGQKNKVHPSITLNSLRGDVHSFTQFKLGVDDRTAVLVQLRPLRGTRRGTIVNRRANEYLDLPRQLDQLKPLRDRIAVIAIDQSDEFIQMLTLAAFEAATNVIRHTPSKLNDAPLTIVLKRTQEAIRIELIYEGEAFFPSGPPTPDFSGDSDGGFGLFIIESSVDHVEYGSPMPSMASICLIKNISESISINT